MLRVVIIVKLHINLPRIPIFSLKFLSHPFSVF